MRVPGRCLPVFGGEAAAWQAARARVASALFDEQRRDWLRLIREREYRSRTFRTLAIVICGGARCPQNVPDTRSARRRRPPGPHLLERGGRALNFEEDSATPGGSYSSASSGPAPYPRRLRRSSDPPPLLGVKRTIGGAGAAGDRDGRLAQRLGGQPQDRGAAGPGSRRRRARDRLGPRTRRRCYCTSREPRGRYNRRARRRPRPHLSGAAHRPTGVHPQGAGLAVSRIPLGYLSPERGISQQNRLISGLPARRGGGRGGKAVWFADHRAHGPGTGSEEVFAVPSSPRRSTGPREPTTCSSRAPPW